MNQSSVKDGDSAQPDIVTQILSAARILELETQTEIQTASVGQGLWAGVSQSQPSVLIPVAEDYSQMLSKAWNNPKTAPSIQRWLQAFCQNTVFYRNEHGRYASSRV